MSDQNDNTKDKIFKDIQSYLKEPPVIIWGSGATVPFGLPTMNDLTSAIRKELPDFSKGYLENELNKITDEPKKNMMEQLILGSRATILSGSPVVNDLINAIRTELPDFSGGNLEDELSKITDETKKNRIKQIIWEEINRKDLDVQQRIQKGECNNFGCIIKMIEKFRETHPQVVSIVTTNYDCTLEYLLAWHGIHFTDGFTGKLFSKFDLAAFSDKNIVNIVKVHGSLNWFKVDDTIRFLNRSNPNNEPVFIMPGKNKYEEAYATPFRELIQKSDDIINKAKSFLVVGFGFNDKHLTPRIKEKVRSGTPLVLITKKVSDSCTMELTDGKKCLFIEEEEGKTKVTIKNNESKQEFSIGGNYWQLNQFMEVI